MITFFFKNNLIFKFFIMAIFQLGALVTEIVGSIGGTTFKRQGSSRVMMRKSNGASRSKLLQNPRLGQNASIFQKWRNLSGADQAGWTNIAADNTVKNKFGENVHISGTNFQRKMDLQVNFLGYVPDPLDWSPEIGTMTFASSPGLNWEDANFLVTLNSDDVEEAYIALMLEFSLQPLNAPTFISRGVYFSGLVSAGVAFNTWDAFYAIYGDIPNLNNYRMYAYVFTPSGVVGTMFESPVTIIV
jgi:hypothetical protein